MIKYTEISVLTTKEGSELIAEAFFSIGCEGVAIYDKTDLLEFLKSQNNWDYVDENLLDEEDSGVRVVGFVKTKDLKTAKTELDEIFVRYISVNAVAFGSLETTYKNIGEINYCEEWKKYYSPIKINNITIVPKWIDYKPSQNETAVLIDPKMAFGTGEHESTQLAIELFSECEIKNKRVIDIGAGSGILSIAALNSGAKKALLIDIDKVALRCAKENVILNGVEKRAEFIFGNLLDKTEISADMIFANITADVLIRLAKTIYPYLNEGGILVCSGIIHKRAEEVKQAFSNAGLIFDKGVTRGEWQAFRYLKPKG